MKDVVVDLVLRRTCPLNWDTYIVLCPPGPLVWSLQKPQRSRCETTTGVSNNGHMQEWKKQKRKQISQDEKVEPQTQKTPRTRSRELLVIKPRDVLETKTRDPVAVVPEMSETHSFCHWGLKMLLWSVEILVLLTSCLSPQGPPVLCSSGLFPTIQNGRLTAAVSPTLKYSCGRCHHRMVNVPPPRCCDSVF